MDQIAGPQSQDLANLCQCVSYGFRSGSVRFKQRARNVIPDIRVRRIQLRRHGEPPEFPGRDIRYGSAGQPL